MVAQEKSRRGGNPTVSETRSSQHDVGPGVDIAKQVDHPRRHIARGWPSVCVDWGQSIDVEDAWESLRLDVDAIHTCGGVLHRGPSR